MTDTPTAQGPPKRRGWLRKLIWVAGTLLILLVVFYFVATSSAFFKGVILPKISKALNATVTVEEASISPFSQVVLRNLQVRTTGAEPLVTAAELRARYSLWKILRGTIQVEEVVLASPVVQIIKNADGTSNLDPILKTEKKSPEAKPSSSSSKPPQIDIRKLALNNATVRMVQHHKAGGRDVTELSNVTLTMADLKNAQTGKLSLAADIKMDNNPPAPGTNSQLQAAASGSFTFDLSAELKPTAIKGNTRLTVQKAGGAMSELAGLVANVDCEVTPTDIKQVALRFQKDGANLGELRVSGPFDMAKTEGRLKAEILSIDRQVLNLAGAASGIDFGTTTINATNQIDLARAGSLITAVGQFTAAKVSLTQKGQTTPTLDLQFAYHVIVNKTEHSALLQGFTLSGTQNQRPLLRADLTSPMNVAWGKATNAVGDSTLKLALTGLSLADWKPFLGEAAPSGNVNLTLNLLSQQAGKQLSLDLASQIEGLAAKFGSNQLNQVNVTLQARGQSTDLKKITLSEYRLQLAQQGQPALLSLAGSGQFDRETQEANLQVTLEAAVAPLLAALPQPGLSASSGTAELKARVTRTKQTQTMTGHLALLNFKGQSGDYKFENLGTVLDLDIELKDQQLQIRKAAGTVSEGLNPGGGYAATGNYDISKNSGQFTLKLSDLNQNALRPFLAPMLGDKQLVSVSVNANTSATYDTQGESSLKADLQLDKLVVSDPKKPLPTMPLGAKIQLDASLRKQTLDLRQCQLSLSPTPRAKNELQFQGQVDLSKSNAIQGSLKLVADSLDVTPYYDLFADKPPASRTSPPGSTAVRPPSTEAAVEPAPLNLPFRNFGLDVNIGRLYLRELEVTNWQAGVKIDGGRVLVKPFQLTLNGAPINANIDLNLGVPGYQYDVAFTADKVPVQPLANTFSPTYRGQAKGDLLANIQLKGSGVTGVSLQKNLNGQLNLTFTNADIQLVGPKMKLLITPIALVLRLNDLMKSPLNWLAVQAKVGEGKINLTHFEVVSDAFTADTQGEIPIAAVFTNSPLNNLPVNFALRRSLAEKANLVPSDAPTNTAYVKLPKFVKVSGTLGDPKTHTDKLVIAGLVAKSAAGLPGVVGEKAGNILQGVGGILTGDKSSRTNQASTNKPPKFNPLDLLKPKK